MKTLMTSHNIIFITLMGILFVGICLLTPFPVSATDLLSYTQDLTFTTENQSLWGSGASFIINYGDFWRVSWDEGGSFGGFVLGTGAEVWAATNGTIGLDFGFLMDSGSVDVLYPVNVELVYPEEAEPGEMITISSQYTVDSSAYFSTNFPEIQTYLELIFDFYAGLGGEACVAWACTSDSISIDEYKELELLAFNRDDDGEFRLLGGIVGGFQFGEPYDFGYGNITVWIPDIETTATFTGDDTLTSEGESDLFQLTIDIDAIATSLLGVPPLEGSFWIFDYNFLDVHAGPDLDIEQQFSFDPDLMIRLDLGNGEVVEFPFGSSIQIPMPAYDLDLTPTFSIAGNTFSNDTLLGIGLAGFISALEAGVEYIGDIGPLVYKDWGFDLLDVTLFSKQFPLLGFQDFTTDSFTVKVIPEPGTLILFGLGLLSLRLLRRKKNS